jgi:hypothetical protein
VVRCQVLTAASVIVVWDVAPCSLVSVHVLMMEAANNPATLVNPSGYSAEHPSFE